MFVIAFGNAFDGLTLVGPFEFFDEAEAFATEEDYNWPYEIVTLTNPLRYAEKFQMGV